MVCPATTPPLRPPPPRPPRPHRAAVPAAASGARPGSVPGSALWACAPGRLPPRPTWRLSSALSCPDHGDAAERPGLGSALRSARGALPTSGGVGACFLPRGMSARLPYPPVLQVPGRGVTAGQPAGAAGPESPRPPSCSACVCCAGGGPAAAALAALRLQIGWRYHVAAISWARWRWGPDRSSAAAGGAHPE